MTEERAFRALLAEPDDRIASLITHRFSRSGIETERCTMGDDVVAFAELRDPHLLLIDAELPGMSGFELLRRFRVHPRFSNHPIVLLSWSPNDAECARAFDLGADDYLTKPFSPIELTARVRRLLARTYPNGS